MSGRQVSRSNTHNRMSRSNNASFLPRASGWTQPPSLYMKRPRTPSGSSSEFSSSSNHSERSQSPGSPPLPLRKICMGRPYNSKCVETSHLMTPKVARKSSCRGSTHCILCADRPSRPSSPTFLDHLIKGINYLDRSTNAFYSNYPRTSLSLPRLAASYLERAANSLNLDHLDHPLTRSFSTPCASMTTSDNATPSTCMVPSLRGANVLQCLDDSMDTSLHRPHCRHIHPVLTQRLGTKLPELPLFGNGLFSLGRLPKIWEAIRSGWSTPEPISKPSIWW
uniref:Uncharacterized protein n=1 Tax=Otolemur garnettii TaxID=30611 RepID=H0XVG5_OTOGA